MSSTLSLALELATTAYHRRLLCQGAAQARDWLELLPASRYAWFLLPDERDRLPALVAVSPIPPHRHPPTVYWAEAA